MDANNFQSSIKELTNQLMMGNLIALDITKTNSVLQYAIQNSEVNNTDLHAFLIALNQFKSELPPFIVLQINLINELHLYKYMTNGVTPNVEACPNVTCSTPVADNITPTAAGPDTEKEHHRISMTPEEIAATAGMMHREIQIDPSNRTKTVKTYEHMADGTLSLVSTEVLTEPDEEDIFANILGEGFSKDVNSPQLGEDDL